MANTDERYRKYMHYFAVIILLLFAILCIVSYQNSEKKYCLEDPYTKEIFCTKNKTEFDETMRIYNGERNIESFATSFRLDSRDD